MSRSNPNAHSSNPCTRWFEWSGSDGVVKYYDKEAKKELSIGDKFTFMLLDRLAVIKGWSEKHGSGITSNEIRDTRGERLVVSAFKGGVLAEGFYTSIKDRVKAVGGHFTASLYIAFKNDEKKLVLGNLQLKGAALNTWVEFERLNKGRLYEKAVSIDGFVEDKKGKVVFRVPIFKLTDISAETDAAASAVDKDVLQPHLKGYFSKAKVEQAQPSGEQAAVEEERQVSPPDSGDAPPADDDDNLPF